MVTAKRIADDLPIADRSKAFGCYRQIKWAFLSRMIYICVSTRVQYSEFIGGYQILQDSATGICRNGAEYAVMGIEITYK